MEREGDFLKTRRKQMLFGKEDPGNHSRIGLSLMIEMVEQIIFEAVFSYFKGKKMIGSS